jgi:hypothetical protein
MKLYEAIADSLVAEGVDTLFGLMGDGNMSLWGALGAGKNQHHLLAQRGRRGGDVRRLRQDDRQGRRRHRHLRTRTDPGRHLPDGRRARPHADRADHRRDPAWREEQPAIDGPAQIRRGVRCAFPHHHQRRQRRRRDRRGILRRARAPHPGGAQPADRPAGEKLRLGLGISAITQRPATVDRGTKRSRADRGGGQTDRRRTPGDHRRTRRAGGEADHPPPGRAHRRAAGDLVAGQGPVQR